MTDAEILKEALEHFALAAEAEKPIREESDKCLAFLALEQWTDKAKQDRGDKPALTMDQLGQFKDQVVNDWRRNRLGIKVSPVDSGADIETAEKLDGLIRNIFYQSKGHVAVDTAFEYCTGGGRGFVGLSTKRVPGTFRQEIVIRRFQNPDAVYLDPFAKEIDWSDMRFAFVRELVSMEQFKKDFPKASTGDFAPYAADTSFKDWITDKGIWLAEYWRVEENPRKLQMLTAPIPIKRNKKPLVTDVVYDTEYKELPQGVSVMEDADGNLMEEDEPERVIRKYLINGVEILERTRWAGQYIPIIPMMGREMWVKGKRHVFSLISRALDAQRMVNYYVSEEANAIQRMGKYQFDGYVGQDKTMQREMANSNLVNRFFIGWDPVSVDGKPAPLPRMNQFEPAIQGLSIGLQQTMEFMKGCVGMYNSAIGKEDGRAKSGIAIRSLQQEGDNASFDFLDNGARALELLGCQIVDLVPHIYDTAAILRVLGEDNQPETIAINQDLEQMLAQGQQPPEKQERAYFFDTGKYDVTVRAAMQHETQRQEAAEMGMKLLEIAPPEMQAVIFPIVVGKQDWPGAQEIAQALKPPEEGDVPPHVKQQMDQMAQMTQMLTQKLQEAMQALNSKQMELQAKKEIELAKVQAGKDSDEIKARYEIQRLEIERDKLDLEWKIAQLKADTDKLITAAEIESKEDMARVNAQNAERQQDKQLNHEREAAVTKE